MPSSGSSLEAAWYRGSPWLWLLLPIEGLFRVLAATRRWLYSSGIFSSYRAPRPVAVVGNITVGGTGKTPVVISLVEALQARGITPGVVSRGYGATATEFPHRLSSQSEASQCGDEPLLIFQRTGVACVVDPDRGRAVQTLLASGDIDLVISDDGLQHYGLQRDYEIALLDAQRGTGNGHCLPVGPLREPVSRLSQVDQVLYRGGSAPDSAVIYQPVAWINLVTAEQRPLSAFSDGDVTWSLAGIGQPAQFFASLESLGVAFDPRVFPDHHAYRAEDFAGLGDRTILMTEKDAVKCRHLAGDNAWYLRIDAELPASLVNALAELARN